MINMNGWVVPPTIINPVNKFSESPSFFFPVMRPKITKGAASIRFEVGGAPQILEATIHERKSFDIEKHIIFGCRRQEAEADGTFAIVG